MKARERWDRFRITTMRRGADRVIAGVSSGVAEALRVDPLIVRIGFVVLAVAGGIGIPLYFGLWWLMPGPDGERDIHVNRIGHLDLHHGDLRQPLAIGLIVAGTVLLLRNVGPWFSDAAVWPLTLAGFGVAVLWAKSDDTERARLTEVAGRPFQALLGGRQGALRLGIGAVLVFAGILAFLAANDALTAARQVGLAVVVTIAGLAVILGPWARRLLADLGEERRERIRSEERAEVAAHLHDSVLQTLALIQRNADRPRQLAALARRQERELRSWLYGDRLAMANGHHGTLAAAVDAMVAEVEDRHEIEVEVVTVGECAVDARVEGLLQARGSCRQRRQARGRRSRLAVCRGGTRPTHRLRPRPRPRVRHDERAGRPSWHRRVDPPAHDAPWRQCRHRVGTGRRNGSHAGAHEIVSTRVFLVDDHRLFLSGVQAELAARVDVVGTATDVNEAIGAIRDLQPDVVLVDVHLPGGGGKAIIESVLRTHPDTRFLALSVSDAAEDVIAIIRAGARGYVTKSIGPDELADAVRRVNEGDAVFSPRLAGFVLDAFAGEPVVSSASAARDDPSSTSSPPTSARSCASSLVATRTRRSPGGSRSR